MLTPSTHGTRHAIVSFFTMVCMSLPSLVLGGSSTQTGSPAAKPAAQSSWHSHHKDQWFASHTSFPPAQDTSQPFQGCSRILPAPRRMEQTKECCKATQEREMLLQTYSFLTFTLLAICRGCSALTPQKAAHRGCKNLYSCSLPAAARFC